MRIVPIVILLILSCVGIGIAIEKHGKPKKGKESFLGTFVGWILQWALILWAIL